MRRSRGFTLIELAITVTIIGILAAVAYGVQRAASRNATLSRATFDVVMRARQLQSRALREQRIILFVMVDAANASACGFGSPGNCAQYFILEDPAPAWTLNAFDPNSPGANLGTNSQIESFRLYGGIRFHQAASGTPPAPFTIPLGFFEPAMQGSCGGRSCFAIRFTQSGDVRGELAAGGITTSTAFAAALTTDLLSQNNAADRKGVIFAFPSGIVRSFPVY